MKFRLYTKINSINRLVRAQFLFTSPLKHDDSDMGYALQLTKGVTFSRIRVLYVYVVWSITSHFFQQS